MTAEQIKAIAAMQITQEMSQHDHGRERHHDGRGPTRKWGYAWRGGQPPAGGDMAQGEPPAGGPSGGGQQPGADQMGTPPAEGGTREGGMGFIPSELIDALIQLLAQKTGS